MTHSQLYSSDEASQSNFLHANKDAASARLTDEIGRNSLLSPGMYTGYFYNDGALYRCALKTLFSMFYLVLDYLYNDPFNACNLNDNKCYLCIAVKF